MKKLFNIRMADNGTVIEHLNEFNTITSQLESVVSVFDDEVRALLLLSSLPNSWNNLVVVVGISSRSKKLKLDDVIGFILGEESSNKSLGELAHGRAREEVE